MKMRVFGLLVRHQKLDEQLRREQSRPAPDVLRIAKLKKLKLAIKDRLHWLSLGRRTQAA